MKQQIVEECARRGTCPMNRTQFDETFVGRDLTIQVRAALDFARQNGLAFGRSMGDQHFVFSRLAPENASASGHGEGMNRSANGRPVQSPRKRNRGQGCRRQAR
ncbi:MAG: hypothetical protein AB9869_29935 [Verrucomicrobiia bacterium]